MADHVSLNGQVSNVNLDSTYYHQDVFCIGSLIVPISKLVQWEIVERRGCEDLRASLAWDVSQGDLAMAIRMVV